VTRLPGMRSARGIVTAVLLPALFFRASIPADYMVRVDVNGLPAVVMCSGAVLAPDQLAASGTRDTGPVNPGPGDRDASGSICAFAASGHCAPPPALSCAAIDTLGQVDAPLRRSIDFKCPSITRVQSPRAPPKPETPGYSLPLSSRT
jgi:hypothetical protein